MSEGRSVSKFAVSALERIIFVPKRPGWPTAAKGNGSTASTIVETGINSVNSGVEPKTTVPGVI